MMKHMHTAPGGCLLLGVLVLIANVSLAEVVPVWILEVSNDARLSATVTKNLLMDDRTGMDAQRFPVRFVPISWSNRHMALPEGTKPNRRSRWLEVGPTGTILGDTPGHPEHDGATMTVDRQRLVLLNVADRGKVSTNSQGVVVTVASAALAGPPQPYRAWRLAPDGGTGILVAGRPPRQAAHFIDVNSGRVKARVAGFVDFSFAARGALVAGTETSYDGAMPARARVLVCTLDAGVKYQGPWVDLGHPIPSQSRVSFDAQSVLFRRDDQLYSASLAGGGERLLTDVAPGRFFFSRDGLYVVSVTTTDLLLYNLLNPLQPQHLWSHPHPGNKYVQDVEVADNGEFVAYHLSVLRNPLSYELRVIGVDGQLAGEVRGQRGVRAGLEFVGSEWLFEGMEYPDSGYGPPSTDTTEAVTLFRCSDAGRR